MSEHYRPNGLAQGYFCSRCGAAGLNMYGTGHGPGQCFPNPVLVDKLRELNSAEAEAKRKFMFELKHGK